VEVRGRTFGKAVHSGVGKVERRAAGGRCEHTDTFLGVLSGFLLFVQGTAYITGSLQVQVVVMPLT
jgi:hypothetical protein